MKKRNAIIALAVIAAVFVGIWFNVGSSEFFGLTRVQKHKIEKLREEGERAAGTFWWQEKVIFGEISEDSPRLDLETTRAIIAENTEFSDIMAEFEKIQLYPDFTGGSGFSLIEYWLDEDKNERIFIVYEAKLIYWDYRENKEAGDYESVLLYGE